MEKPTAVAAAPSTAPGAAGVGIVPGGTKTPDGEPEQRSLPLVSALRAAPEPIQERIRAAHVRPLVGLRTASDEVICIGRRAPSQAWSYPILEWLRAGHAQAAIGLDLDDPAGVGLALDALRDTGAKLPQPSVVAVREASGHALAVWGLASPVARGPKARQGPRRFLGRVAEYLAWETGADAGFVGVLAANPEHPDYRAFYGRRDPYELRELAAFIPDRWRRAAPRELRTEAGRNCYVFLDGCRFAGILSRTDEAVAGHVRATNGGLRYLLEPTEVAGIVRSINGHYRPQWRSKAARLDFGAAFRERQAWRGQQSGKARRAGSAEERQPWAAEGVSRATWYRRRAEAEGRETRTNTGTRLGGGSGGRSGG